MGRSCLAITAAAEAASKRLQAPAAACICDLSDKQWLTFEPFSGASGDLASKKTYPALQFLYQNG